MEISLNMLTIMISRYKKTLLVCILNEELYIEFEIDCCRMHGLIVLMLNQNMLEKALL